MKIRTASTRKAIDNWKSRARDETTKFHSWAFTLVARTITSPRRGRTLIVIPLIVALLLNFAALELVVLIVIGFFVTKLCCYRFINSMMKLMSFSQ